jgi:hypothetical protein
MQKQELHYKGSTVIKCVWAESATEKYPKCPTIYLANLPKRLTNLGYICCKKGFIHRASVVDNVKCVFQKSSALRSCSSAKIGWDKSQPSPHMFYRA